MEQKQLNQTYDIIQTCLLAGKIMLENGAETYRVEDTMTRIAASFGIRESHSFVMPTGIIFSMDGLEPTKLLRISDRSTDLQKVTLVNSISRRISQGELSAKDAYHLLKEVEASRLAYPLAVQIGAAAIASGGFLIMYQGGWHDFLPAFLCGGIGFACVLYFQRFVQIKFIAEFVAAFMVGLLSFALVQMGFGRELDKIIIGSVMPLVPGLLMTNAVRDLMAGHLVSGISRGAEAFLTSFAIGAGIAVVFSLTK